MIDDWNSADFSSLNMHKEDYESPFLEALFTWTDRKPEQKRPDEGENDPVNKE